MSNARLNRISSICEQIATVSLASVVLPYILDRFDLRFVLLGTVGSALFWVLSIIAARN